AHGRAARLARDLRPTERRRDLRRLRRGLHPQAEERLPLIRAAVAAPAALLEELRARFVELAPEGFEEAERGGEVELAADGDAAGARGLSRRTRERGGGGLGGPLARVPPARPCRAALGRPALGGAAGRRAGRRRRPGTRLWHRRARDDTPLPRAAARGTAWE